MKQYHQIFPSSRLLSLYTITSTLFILLSTIKPAKSFVITPQNIKINAIASRRILPHSSNHNQIEYDKINVQNIQKQWEQSYNNAIAEEGIQLCALAYEGFLKDGRGAILFREESKKKSTESNYNEIAASSTTYITKNEWSERMSKTPREVQNIQEILKRISTYNPNFEFCVVYQAKGIMGCDVVRPDTKPEEVAKLVKEENERLRNTSPSLEDLRVDEEDDGAIEVTQWDS